jgi:hypothetical protein
MLHSGCNRFAAKKNAAQLAQWCESSSIGRGWMPASRPANGAAMSPTGDRDTTAGHVIADNGRCCSMLHTAHPNFLLRQFYMPPAGVTGRQP